MNEPISLSDRTEQKLERLLKASFQPHHSMSPDFEAKVMSSIHRRHETSKNERTVLIAMMIYWAFASLSVAWLLSGNQPPQSAVIANHLKIALIVLGLVAAGLFFLMRQSSLKLSDLFLRTIQ